MKKVREIIKSKKYQNGRFFGNGVKRSAVLNGEINGKPSKL